MAESVQALENAILVALAGNEAVRWLTGRPDGDGARLDHDTAAYYLSFLEPDPRKRRGVFQWLQWKAYLMLRSVGGWVDDVAIALSQQQTLTFDQVNLAIVEGEAESEEALRIRKAVWEAKRMV